MLEWCGSVTVIECFTAEILTYVSTECADRSETGPAPWLQSAVAPRPRIRG